MPHDDQAETTPDSSAIVELRRYALLPGARDTLIEVFDREFVETQEELGMQLLGQFRDLDDPDSFVWIRGFTDMESRLRGLTDFYTGPAWKAHAAVANATMLSVDNVLLLRPLDGLAQDAAARAAPGSTASPPGLLAVTIYPLMASTASDFPDHFHTAIQPQLEAAGVAVTATYATEHSPNTFPALPVREGEEVFVWMAAHADEAQHARTGEIAHVETRWLSGQPEVLRLRPTARSRWHL